MNTRAQRPGMRCREVFSPLAYGSVAVQRRPTMKPSAYHWPTPGKQAPERRVPSCSLSLLITTPVRHAAARKDSRLSLTAAVAVEMWKSRAFAFGAISKRGGKRGKVPVSLGGFSPCRPDFSTLSTARHFHSEYPNNPFRLGVPWLRTDRFCGGSFSLALTLVLKIFFPVR